MDQTQRTLLVIAHEYLPFSGGIATYVAGIESELKKHCLSYVLLVPDYSESDESDVCVCKLKHHQITLSSIISTLFLLFQYKKSIVHAVDIRSVLLAYLGSRLFGFPFRATVHGSEMMKIGGAGFIKRVARLAYESASVVLVNSHATEAIVRKTIKPRRLKVTHLGVEAHWFEPVNSDFENDHLKDVPVDHLLVCTLGRLEPRKGHAKAIEALSQEFSAEELKKLTYVAAGPILDEGYAQYIIELASNHGIGLLVTGFLSISDVKLLYQRSVCHLLCAEEMGDRIEGFGLVVVEAAAQGCPTVATNVGGLAEVIINDVTGYLCRPDSTEEIGLAIRRLTRQELRKGMGESAIDLAQKFTWTQCASSSYPELFLNSA